MRILLFFSSAVFAAAFILGDLLGEATGAALFAGVFLVGVFLPIPPLGATALSLGVAAVRRLGVRRAAGDAGLLAGVLAFAGVLLAGVLDLAGVLLAGVFFSVEASGAFASLAGALALAGVLLAGVLAAGDLEGVLETTSATTSGFGFCFFSFPFCFLRFAWQGTTFDNARGRRALDAVATRCSSGCHDESTRRTSRDNISGGRKRVGRRGRPTGARAHGQNPPNAVDKNYINNPKSRHLAFLAEERVREAHCRARGEPHRGSRRRLGGRRLGSGLLLRHGSHVRVLGVAIGQVHGR